MIIINIGAQTLTAGARQYRVSTAKNGVGEINGSEQTPRGRHIIRAKIGDNAPKNAVFVGRRQTGEIYTPTLAAAAARKDWILTRILWLRGCERGINRGGNVDTMRRYIYIHGAPDSAIMGIPGSIGCIRMHNNDVIELFNAVTIGTAVNIIEGD